MGVSEEVHRLEEEEEEEEGRGGEKIYERQKDSFSVVRYREDNVSKLSLSLSLFCRRIYNLRMSDDSIKIGLRYMHDRDDHVHVLVASREPYPKGMLVEEISKNVCWTEKENQFGTINL